MATIALLASPPAYGQQLQPCVGTAQICMAPDSFLSILGCRGRVTDGRTRALSTMPVDSEASGFDRHGTLCVWLHAGGGDDEMKKE
eukprot:1982797-Pyramimonas_sp.AAC.1